MEESPPAGQVAVPHPALPHEGEVAAGVGRVVTPDASPSSAGSDLPCREAIAGDADEAGGSPSCVAQDDSQSDAPQTPHQAWFQELLKEPYETVYIEQSMSEGAAGSSDRDTPVNADDLYACGFEEDLDMALVNSVRNLDTGEVRDLREDFDPSFYGEWQDPSALMKSEVTRPWERWWQESRRRTEDLWKAAETGKNGEVLGVLEAASNCGGALAALVNSRSLYGRTALHMAALGGHAQCVEALLQSKADAHARTKAGCTALHQACDHGHLEVVRVLHAAGCDMRAQTLLGESPLHLAAAQGHTGVLTYLLEKCSEAHLNLRNNYGQRPAEVARDIDTRALFDSDEFRWGGSSGNSSFDDLEDRYAGRTAFQQAVLLRNSRQDAVQRLLIRTGVDASPPSLSSFGGGDAAGGVETAVDEKEELTRRTSGGASTSRLRCGSRRVFSKLREDGIEVAGPDSFLLKALVGKGSFGEVYRVVHKRSGQAYAMKVLRKSKIFGRNLVRYAVTERNLLSYIKHPFIVRLHYAFQTPTCLVLVLQYCPGGNLATLLAHEGSIGEALAQLYIAEVFLAIEYLHERQVVYRDMKPENVVLDEGNHAMLTDFGLSKEGVEGLRGTRSFCGSTAYLAPEVLAKAGHGPPVDLYGLGVLLHELLTGQPPYYNRDRKTLLRNIAEALLQVPPYVSRPAASFIQSMLHRNPAHRLGAQNTSEARGHAFFAGVDWGAVLRREVPVPVQSPASRSREIFGACCNGGAKVASPFEGRFEAQVRRLSSPPQDLAGWDFATAASPTSPPSDNASQTPSTLQRHGRTPRKTLQAPAFF